MSQKSIGKLAVVACLVFYKTVNLYVMFVLPTSLSTYRVVYLLALKYWANVPCTVGPMPRVSITRKKSFTATSPLNYSNPLLLLTTSYSSPMQLAVCFNTPLLPTREILYVQYS